MPTVIATIEIDCPEGYEPVAFRFGRKGEYYVSSDGREACKLLVDCDWSALIVRPVWKAPAWMPKGAWLYPHYNHWKISRVAPEKAEDVQCGWYRPFGCFVVANDLAVLHGETFVPPPTREPIQIQ